MWTLLLQGLRLTAEGLRARWEERRGEEGGEEGAAEAEWFLWPSFFRAACEEAEAKREQVGEGSGDGTKRRKRRRRGDDFRRFKHSKHPLLAEEAKNKDWLSLLGYAAARALLSPNHPPRGSSPSSGSVAVRRKVAFLTEAAASLPDALGIREHDVRSRRALKAGVAARVLDEVAEWIVLDGLALGESRSGGTTARAAEGGGGGAAGGIDGWDDDARLNEDVCERLRAGVEEVADVLLLDGAMARLAELAGAPLPDLTAQSANALLDYSEVHHRLRLGLGLDLDAHPADGGDEIDDEAAEEAESLLSRPLAEDARVVVKFVHAADPSLGRMLLSRDFSSSASVAPSPSSFLAAAPPAAARADGATAGAEGGAGPGSAAAVPVRPVATLVRAVLLAEGSAAAARLCRAFEECAGLDRAAKLHCWVLLYERMHLDGALFEEGWGGDDDGDGEGGVRATPATIVAGPVGRECVHTYLRGIVSEARDAWRAARDGGDRGRGWGERDRAALARAETELLCVKDAVRRTSLRLLLPRSCAADALTMASKLASAEDPPELEKLEWGGKKSAAGVACSMLARPGLYARWDEERAEAEAAAAEAAEVAEADAERERLKELEQLGELEDQVQREAVREAFEGAPEGVAEDETGDELAAKQSTEFVAREYEGGHGTEERGVPVPAEQGERVAEEAEEEKEEEVILLDDSDEEAEPATEPAKGPAGNIAGGEEEEEDEVADYEPEEDSELEEATAARNQEDEDENAEDAAKQKEEAEEEDVTYPTHYHQYPGNYSESDDYSAEDDEEGDRHAAFEGEYDEEEGRGESEGDDDQPHPRFPHAQREGETDLVEILSSSEEEEKEEEEEGGGEEEKEDDTNVLNEKVDRYIAAHEGAPPVAPAGDERVVEEEARMRDEARILGEAVHDYIVPGTGRRETDEGADEAGTLEGEGEEVESVEAVEPPVDQKGPGVGGGEEEDEAEEEVEAGGSVDYDWEEAAEASAEGSDDDAVVVVVQEEAVVDGEAKAAGEAGQGQGTAEAEDSASDQDGEEKEGSVDEQESEPGAEEAVIVAERAHDDELDKASANEDISIAAPASEAVPAEEDAITEADQGVDAREAEEGRTDDMAEAALAVEDEIPGSSERHTATEDGTDEDDDTNMADDEHESIDTETFDETDAGTERPGSATPQEKAPVPPVDTMKDEPQPSADTLVAAAMSSQRQQPGFAASPEPVGDTRSYDNTSAALASAGADLWENYDEASQQGTDVDGSENVQVVARYHGQDLNALGSVLEAHVDAEEDALSRDESGPEDKRGGQMTDDGYNPDESEATEEERRRPGGRKKPSTPSAAVDDGYDPDAEATEEERRPERSVRKDDRDRSAAASAVKPAIDEGYVPDASEVSEVEQVDDSAKKRGVETTRDVTFKAVLETRIGHAGSEDAEATTTAPPPPPGDAPAPEAPPTSASRSAVIDPGYIPTDDGLTEEERDRRLLRSSSPSKKKPAHAAASIDEGYLPDGAMTEEEMRGYEVGAALGTRRRQRVGGSGGRASDDGYVPDAEATAEEDLGEERRRAGATGSALRVMSPPGAARDESSSHWEPPSRQLEKFNQGIAAETGASTTAPADKRPDDAIDEGYLPSAVEGTEEERSETEDDATAKAVTAGDRKAYDVDLADNPVNDDKGHKEEEEKEEEEEEEEAEGRSMNMLVATASALQKRPGGGGGRVGSEALPTMTGAENGERLEGGVSDQGGTCRLPLDGEIVDEEDRVETADVKEETTDAVRARPPSPPSASKKGEAYAKDDGAMELESECVEGTLGRATYGFEGAASKGGDDAKTATGTMRASADVAAAAPVGEFNVDAKDGDAGTGEDNLTVERAGVKERDPPPSSELLDASEKGKVGEEVEEVAAVAEDGKEDTAGELAVNREETKTEQHPVDLADAHIPEATRADKEGRTVLVASAAGVNKDGASDVANTLDKLSGLTVAKLKDRLRQLGLPVSGRKQELVDRIMDYLNPKPEAGKEEPAEEDGVGSEAASEGSVGEANIDANDGGVKTDVGIGEDELTAKQAREMDQEIPEKLLDTSEGGKVDAKVEEVAVAEEKGKEDTVGKVDEELDVIREWTKTEQRGTQESVDSSAQTFGVANPDMPEETHAESKGRTVLVASAAGNDEDDADSVGDLSQLTLKKLKEKLRQLDLPVSGRKQELIDRIVDHLNPKPEGESNEPAEEGGAGSKASSKGSKKRKAASAGVAVSKRRPQPSTATPSSSKLSSSVRKSARAKQPLLKAQKDTPVSELSHRSEAEDDDSQDSSQELQEEHFAHTETETRTKRRASSRSAKGGQSPGVPKSITTRARDDRKLPVLPSVPEGNVVEGATAFADFAAADADGKPEDSSTATKSAGSKRRTIRQAKESDDESDATDDVSVHSKTRGGKRRARGALDDDNSSIASGASKRPKRSTRTSKRTDDGSEDDASESSSRVSKTRRKPAKKTDESKASATALRRGRTRSAAKTVGSDDESSVASSAKRRAKSVSAKKDDESVSMGTRRSTRSRARK